MLERRLTTGRYEEPGIIPEITKNNLVLSNVRGVSGEGVREGGSQVKKGVFCACEASCCAGRDAGDIFRAGLTTFASWPWP